MNEEVLSAKNFFLSRKIHLSDLWLESCIDWYKEQNPGIHYTKETLYKQIYEQWLLLDFRDVEVPILPPNLSEQVKVILPDSYHLQLMYIVDISKPKYAQLQKIRNKNDLLLLNDQENEPINSKRVLQLTLTDGVHEIQAIEYSTIKTLHLGLSPGIKLQIIGPVTVRRGQIILEEKNVKILGGEVEELLVSHAPENIMARALGLTETRNPGVIKEAEISNPTITNSDTSTFQQNTIQSSSTQNSNTSTFQQNRIQTNSVQGSGTSTFQQNRIQNNANQTQNNTKITNNLQQRKINDFLQSPIQQDNNYEMSEEDEQRIAEEVEMLLEAERSFNEESEAKELKKSLAPTTSTAKKPKQPDKSAFEFDEDDVFDNIDIDVHLDFVDKKKEKKEENPANALTTISEIQAQRDTFKNAKFRIKARFKFVLDKLTVMDDKWHLKLLIGDDTDDLVINMHSDLITRLIGLSPKEMQSLKQNIMNKEQNTIDQMMKAVGRFKNQIQNLDSEMDIEFKENEDLPVIVILK